MPYHDFRRVTFASANFCCFFTRLKTMLAPLLGILSLLWFVVRVLPKPSRAAYPCQRLALPIATGFVLWLIGLFSSVAIFKGIKKNWLLRRRLYVAAGFFLFLLTSLFTLLNSPSRPARADDDPFVPTDAPNSPMGVARGYFPGRVVWAHNTNAANWNGAGRWWEDRNTNQSAVTAMVSQSLCDLTGASNETTAWNILFRHFNQTHARGDFGYQPGEKIAIKLNLNSCNDHGDNRDAIFITPHLVLALLRQLVENAGVPAENITFYDATRLAPSPIFDKSKAAYSDVKFADWDGGQGRLKVQRALNAPVKWTQDLTLEPDGGNPTYVPTCVAEATYLINLGQLKGHNLAGVTLCAKNLFGSIIANNSANQPNSSAPSNAGLHPYVCVHGDFHFGGHWDFDKRAMGTYNTLVDLLGHQQLGGKTMLFIVDGLYSTPDQSTALKTSHKWQSFGNDWPNSLFMSQDPIALESVCVDFLRNEPTQVWVRGNIDNYLHEAALADNPPSGKPYDPERDGKPLASLGAHEHWNNATEKKYSRNLGTGDGIELVIAGANTAVNHSRDRNPEQFALLDNYPNPYNGQTVISCVLAESGDASLVVFNLLGERVALLKEGYWQAGRHQFVWNGTDESDRVLPSGIYTVRLVSEFGVTAHRITLAR